MDETENIQNKNPTPNQDHITTNNPAKNKDSQPTTNKPTGPSKDLGIGIGIGLTEKISKKDKMHEVYLLFKELDAKMRKQQIEVEELLKNLRDDQPCPYCHRKA